MAILEMVLQARYFNQLIQNRFHYIFTGTPAAVSPSFGLASAGGFIEDGGAYPLETLFARIRETQNGSVEYDLVSIINLYDPIDFYSVPFPGTVTGLMVPDDEQLSPVTAAGYRTNRVRRDIRRGTKRFVGLTSGQIEDGGVLTNSFLTTRAANLATKMGEILTYDDEGNTLTYTPAILSKQRVVDPETGQVRYQLYPTEQEQEENMATGILWSPYTTTRTQGSRQYDRGQ